MEKEVAGKLAEFDPEDINKIKWLVENSDKFDMPLSGVNDDGETTLVEVTDEFVLVTTFQKNGWSRKNYYYPDGYVEETYSR